jgi:hypothetical protein
VFTAGERVEMVKQTLRGVDSKLFYTTYVFDFDEELADIYKSFFEKEKIVLIKGSEWRDKTIIGKEYVDVFFLDTGKNKMSSTLIKQRIIDWHGTETQK